MGEPSSVARAIWKQEVNKSIMPLRGGFYVDGFNLYHAINDLQKPYLKWLDLRRLAEHLAKGHAHSVERIVFGTAFFPQDFAKRKRHERYNEALKATGVDVLIGHTTKEPARCLACDSRWEQPREKETDINVALSAYHDAVSGRVDVVFVITADTDQAATFRFLRQNVPLVKRIVVTPPGREKSKHLRDLAHANLGISEDDIDRCLFAAMVQPVAGRLVVRPSEYQPPVGWVHPDDRPK